MAMYENAGIMNTVFTADVASLHPGMNESPETIKEKLALADYIYLKRLEHAFRKNSNSDNEKDGV